jgi:hypothetical protein
VSKQRRELNLSRTLIDRRGLDRGYFLLAQVLADDIQAARAKHTETCDPPPEETAIV